MDSNETPRQYTTSFNMRVLPEDLDLWKEAAWLRRLTLSGWARSVLNSVAKQTINAERSKGDEGTEEAG